MSNFKQYKFKSDKPDDIILVVEVFKKLGYKTPKDFFDILVAVTYGGICTWDDGEITEGYLEYNTHEDITLEELKAIMCEAGKHTTDALCYQYKNLLGVQFNKNIYSFRECSPRYVHNIIRDKDGDVCVVDQYEINYKLRDVEFYVSDEHNDTMSYQQYSKFVSI